MITKKLDAKLGVLDDEGRALIQSLQDAKGEIMADFEGLNYAAAMRKIASLADDCNRYFDQHEPWKLIKEDPEKARVVLTTTINAVKVLTTYLKPVVPGFGRKIEEFLNAGELTYANIYSVLENHEINKFQRLVERIDKKKVEVMIEESKDEQAPAPAAAEVKVELDEPIEPECTIDDFMKVDLRVAKVVVAEAVEGARKLLHLELDLGCGIRKNVFAGISKAYKPEDLLGRNVVCVANLKPRTMKFGVSEGMVCAAGPGGADVFVLGVDDGAVPGQRVH
jgi:methionyl-tRNA synthetase